jgi:hypothetical protein
MGTKGDGTLAVEPATTPALLRLLRVDEVPVKQQGAAIISWLTGHEPTRSLRCSLLANGYGHLLNQVQQPTRSKHVSSKRAS